MKINKPTLKAVSLLMAVVMAFVCIPLNAGAVTLSSEEQAKIDAYKQQQSALDGQIASSQEKLDALKADIADEQAYCDELTAQIQNYQTKIDVLQDSISALEVQKAAINEQIDELEAEIGKIKKDINHNDILMLNKQHEIDDIHTELNDSLRDVYVNGTTSPIEYLLACKDFSQYLIMLEISANKAKRDEEIIKTINADIVEIEEINTKNNELIDELNVKVDEKQTQIDALNENERELDAEKGELESAQNEIKALEAESVAKIQSLNQESATYKQMIANYESQQKKLESQIDAVIAAAEAAANPVPNGYSSSSGFIWPLQYSDAYISSAYGYRNSPLTGSYSLHGGVDTCCRSGTQGKRVVATASGTVIYSSFNGYGNCIIIDHGSGYVSLYGHLDSRAVSTGQSVSQGQVIGYAGNTYGPGGYSTGPHLHFEIRVNGSKVNPTNYCRP